jgi:hypothetical protein
MHHDRQAERTCAAIERERLQAVCRSDAAQLRAISSRLFQVDAHVRVVTRFSGCSRREPACRAGFNHDACIAYEAGLS